MRSWHTGGENCDCPRCKEVQEEIMKLPLHVRSIIYDLAALSRSERMDVFREFCSSCGDKGRGCQCWNDE